MGIFIDNRATGAKSESFAGLCAKTGYYCILVLISAGITPYPEGQYFRFLGAVSFADEVADSVGKDTATAPDSSQPASLPSVHVEKESLGRALTDFEKTHTIQKQDKEKSAAASAALVKVGSRVKFHVIMKLENGTTIYDSMKDGRPWSGVVGNGSILSGIDLGIRGMTEGGQRQIWIPPHMGYGANGIQPQVPANAKLYAEVTLLSIDADEQP